MSDMLKSLVEWLVCFAKVVWQSFVDFVHDITIQAIEALLSVVIYLLNLFDLSALTDKSLDTLFMALPTDLLYFLSFLNLPTCFGLIASAYVYRLIRKIITLFQY